MACSSAEASASAAEVSLCPCGMAQDQLTMFKDKLLKCFAPGENPEHPNGAIVCVAKESLLANHNASQPKPEPPTSAFQPARPPAPASAAASAPAAPSVKMSFDSIDEPGFSKDPDFLVTDPSSAKTTTVPAAGAFSYITALQLEDIYSTREYVGQLKSFRSPSETNKRDLEKKHPDIFAKFSTPVDQRNVLSFLANSNPYAPFDAFDAISKILQNIDDSLKLIETICPSSASASASSSAAIPRPIDDTHLIAQSVQQITSNLFDSVANIGTLSGAVNNILGGGAIGTVISEYVKARKPHHQVPLMSAGPNPTDIPRPSGHFLWPFLAKAINQSLPFWRDRVTADARDASETAVAKLIINTQPGTFTDFESLKAKVGFWAYQRFRSPAYNALYGRAVQSFFALLDEEYNENVAKGHNLAMYNTAMRFGHPLVMAPQASAAASAASTTPAGPPPTSARVKVCATDGCNNRFLARVAHWRFCDICRSSHGTVDQARNDQQE